MAHIGILKNRDVYFLSRTFLVILCFGLVMLLILQPNANNMASSMLSLPRDLEMPPQTQAVLEQAITRHQPKGQGQQGSKKGGKGNANSKKENKAKLIKDKLPDKAPNKNSSSAAVAKLDPKKDSHNNPKKLAEDVKSVVPSLQSEVSDRAKGFSLPQANNDEKGAHSANEGKLSDPSFPKPAENDLNAKGIDPLKPDSAQVIDKAEKLGSVRGTANKTFQVPKTRQPFFNLSKTQLDTFESPFANLAALIPKKNKKIVTWFKARDEREVNEKAKLFRNCPQKECTVLYPLPEGIVADAVIFDGIKFKEPPPARASPNQVFVFHNMDPPPFPLRSEWSDDWNTAFNWTWSYRRDSDIWEPLGLLKKTTKFKSKNSHLETIKKKSHTVAWIPETCPSSTSSHRDEFVKELEKYIPIVDMGRCSNRSCHQSTQPCSEILSKRFFFLLALEDDICRDHVTEVFYRAWLEDTDVVPVVRGGANYSTYFPEGTFIDADWFDSARALAEFLNRLKTSKKLYSELLWRKGHWVRVGKKIEDLSMCTLCDKLHHLADNKKRYQDIRHWYEGYACKKPKPF